VGNNFQHAEKSVCRAPKNIIVATQSLPKKQLWTALFAGHSDHTSLLACTADPYSYQEIVSCLLLLFS